MDFEFLETSLLLTATSYKKNYFQHTSQLTCNNKNNIKRTMFTFKKILDKSPKLYGIFNQKSNFSTYVNNFSTNLQENQFEIALALTKYFHVQFSPTPTEIISKLDNIKNALVIYKIFAYAKNTANPFIAKKFFQITFKKESLIFSKNTVIEAANKLTANSNQYTIQAQHPQEKTSTSGVYEVHTGTLFANQQKKVHVILYKSENPNHVTQETQKKSVSMTGQKNCDVEITFKTKLGQKFNSLFDILIGKNKHYKGNLIQTNINNILFIKDHLDELVDNLDTLADNKQDYTKDKLFINIKQKIDSIFQNNDTPQNKTLLIQEQLVDLISVLRKYNYNSYNPNFLVFFEEQTIENKNIENTAKLIQKILPESISFHSSNEIIEQAMKKALPIFIENYHIEWKLLSPADREHCLSLAKKLTPELYIEIMTKIS